MLRYFNGTIISTSFVPLLPVLPVTFSLILNKLLFALASVKSTILPSAAFTGGSLLKYCHRFPDVFE